MTTNNGGAPADGGNEPLDNDTDVGADNGQDNGGDGGEGGNTERRQLTAEEYETRDRQKTEALRRERAQSRQFRTELDGLKRQIEAGGGTRSERQSAQDELDDIPDPEKNPMEALKALRKLASDLARNGKQETEQTKQQQEQQRAIGELTTYVNESEKDFALDQPDYYDAVKHLKTSLRAEYEDQGYRDAGLAQAVSRELLRLANTAKRNNADPAEVYWKLSLRRGFKAKNGEREVENIKRGQEHDTKVPRGGGKNNNFSSDALMNAEGAEFDKLWKVYEQQATGGGRR